jgi:hypothetical protein
MGCMDYSTIGRIERIRLSRSARGDHFKAGIRIFGVYHRGHKIRKRCGYTVAERRAGFIFNCKFLIEPCHFQ